MYIDKNTIVKRSDDIVSAEIEDMTVFMSLEAGNYYGLDEIAVRIWEIAENSTTVGNIIDVLTEEYDVSPEVCEKDAIAFLRELWNEKLLNIE